MSDAQCRLRNDSSVACDAPSPGPFIRQLFRRAPVRTRIADRWSPLIVGPSALGDRPELGGEFGRGLAQRLGRGAVPARDPGAGVTHRADHRDDALAIVEHRNRDRVDPWNENTAHLRESAAADIVQSVTEVLFRTGRISLWTGAILCEDAR